MEVGLGGSGGRAADSRDIGNGRFVYGQGKRLAFLSGSPTTNRFDVAVGRKISLLLRLPPLGARDRSLHAARQISVTSICTDRGGGRQILPRIKFDRACPRVSMYLPFKRINTGTVYGLLIRGRPA